MKPDSIVISGVYVDASLAKWRRVVSKILNANDGETYVIYSIGADVNRVCLLRTFCRWARKRIVVDEEGLIEEVADDTV